MNINLYNKTVEYLEGKQCKNYDEFHDAAKNSFMYNNLNKEDKENKKLKIYYVNGGCGSSKTTRSIPDICNSARLGQNVMIALPSKATMESMRISIDKMLQSSSRYEGIQLVVINSDTASGRVDESIAKFLKKSHSKTILIVSQEAFLTRTTWNVKGWALYYDEIPNPIQSFKINISKHYDDDAKIDCLPHNSAFCKIIPHNDKKQKYEKIIDDSKNDNLDDLSRPLEAFINNITSEYIDVYLEHATYKKVVEGKDIRAEYICNLNINIFREFKTVVMMGAFFKYSLFYKMYLHQIDFCKYKKITPEYEEYPESVTSRITIRSICDFNNSKNFRNNLTKQVYTDSILESLKYLMALEEKYNKINGIEQNTNLIFCANRDVDTTMLGENFWQVSTYSHGMNNFRHIHYAAFLSALNRSPVITNYLKYCGLTELEITIGVVAEVAHQFFMRTSLREQISTKPVQLFVMSRQIAIILATYFFKGAKISDDTVIESFRFSDDLSPQYEDDTSDENASDENASEDDTSDENTSDENASDENTSTKKTRIKREKLTREEKIFRNNIFLKKDDIELNNQVRCDTIIKLKKDVNFLSAMQKNNLSVYVKSENTVEDAAFSTYNEVDSIIQEFSKEDYNQNVSFSMAKYSSTVFEECNLDNLLYTYGTVIHLAKCKVKPETIVNFFSQKCYYIETQQKGKILVFPYAGAASPLFTEHHRETIKYMIEKNFNNKVKIDETKPYSSLWIESPLKIFTNDLYLLDPVKSVDGLYIKPIEIGYEYATFDDNYNVSMKPDNSNSTMLQLNKRVIEKAFEEVCKSKKSEYKESFYVFAKTLYDAGIDRTSIKRQMHLALRKLRYSGLRHRLVYDTIKRL
jgi:hypothetical protein